ncbi:MAG: hypothetical protein E6J39_07485 [Chloroflexi bacterium]|nr:MAG: hypothetical protein E6J39_07485 [Chloroflexota bacterium]
MGPLVDVAFPAVLPVGQPFRGGAGVVDLVEVHRARLIEPPQAVAEGDQHQGQHQQRVKAIEASRRVGEALM